MADHCISAGIQRTGGLQALHVPEAILHHAGCAGSAVHPEWGGTHAPAARIPGRARHRHYAASG